MKIKFKNTFHHIAATQMFIAEHGIPSRLRQYYLTQSVQFYVLLIVVDAAFFLTYGLNVFFILFTLYILYMVFNHPKFNYKGTQAGIYYNCKILHGVSDDPGKDTSVQWEVTPDHIVIQDEYSEFKASYESIDRIIVCPRYLFLDFGSGRMMSLPMEDDSEGDHTVFSEHLIRLYQNYFREQQKGATVVQSQWDIKLSSREMSALDVQADTAGSQTTWSIRKLLCIVLVGIMFLIVGCIFYDAIMTAIRSF